MLPSNRNRKDVVIGLPHLIGYLVRGVGAVIIALVPVAGFWFASSLAAYADGPLWAAALTGLLLFPILPIAWEVRMQLTRNKRPTILTVGDRLLLRTLALNLPFVTLLLVFAPQATIRAVAARGDWMFDNRQSTIAVRARTELHRVADGIGFIHAWAQQKPNYDDPSRRTPAPQPMPDHGTVTLQADSTAASPTSSPVPLPSPTAPSNASADSVWPSEQEPRSKALSVPEDAERSIPSLAHHLAAQASTQVERFRMLHDWVATHIAYDTAGLADGSYIGNQEGTTVLARRVGVCAGYARLLEALGKSAGLDVRFVVGVAKGSQGEVDGAGHAWNIATLDGKAYLVDATWDAGYVNGSEFHKAYNSNYLFTPPEVFGHDHLPEVEADQLREKPISRGDFMRLPTLRAAFFAHGWTLASPNRSQISVQGPFDVHVGRASQRYLIFALQSASGTQTRCVTEVSPAEVVAHCTAPTPGTYSLALLDGPKEFGTYIGVGSIAVIAR